MNQANNKARHWVETGLFPISLTGTRNYHENIQKIARNPDDQPALVFCTGRLIPECGNPYDPNAILIEIDNMPVGHLPNEVAKIFRDALNDKGITGEVTTCSLLIRGGNKTSRAEYFYSIEADIDMRDEPGDYGGSYTSPVRQHGYPELSQISPGHCSIAVFLPAGLLGDMDKNKTIKSWKSRDGETVNYYAQNRVGLGSGYWLFSIPTEKHIAIFGTEKATAKFSSISGRNAVIDISLEV